MRADGEVVFYSADMAPRFTRGMYAMIGVSVALAVWALGIRWLQRRDEGRERGEGGEVKGVEMGVKTAEGVQDGKES